MEQLVVSDLMGWEIVAGGTPLGGTTMKFIFVAIVLVVILTLPLY
ncbi:putative membrane protein [Helicobacter pylori Hp H-3]|nr:putative membrane protein [Helicobacter pylori Hp H-3]